MRQHQRFGPPKLLSESENTNKGIVQPHAGFVPQKAFQSAEFCKTCHQFGPHDLSLNGKLLMNTYEEWRQSIYGEQNISCQSCHMPDKQHLWRGIHDREMTKKAVNIKLHIKNHSLKKGDQLFSMLTVENRRVGHHFPTYITPKVFIRWQLIDEKGEIVPDSFQEDIIGREATLNLSKELYDTRIPAQHQDAFSYKKILPKDNLSLKVTVVVEPDHFYTKAYQSLLTNPQSAKEGRRLLAEALQNTRQSTYTIYERTAPLKPL